MFHVWIFQSNPRYYNLLGDLPDLISSDPSGWPIKQHKNKIKAGDYALLWVSNKIADKRGIYAIARIISDPVPNKYKKNESNTWAEPKDKWVDFEYVEQINPPLLVPFLKEIGLSNLSIIRQPNHTNFPVTKSEWDILSKEIEQRKLFDPCENEHENGFYDAPLNISADLWTKLLEDEKVTTEKDIEVLSLVYRSKNNEMTASEIAQKLNVSHYVIINYQIYRFSKRVLEKTGVIPSWMRNRQFRWWHVPFWGYEKRPLFSWIMRPELVKAFDNILGSEKNDLISPDELTNPDSTPFLEGAVKTVTVNRYERNKKARDACIDHYGNVCTICGFNFEQIYGEIGKNKIIVHHLVPQSCKQEEYVIDPVHDLRPICPNCHLIIHSKNEPFTIEEVKTMISKKSAQ